MLPVKKFNIYKLKKHIEKSNPKFGGGVRDLSFFPINGTRFRLSELQKEGVKAVVIIMREKDCPISEKYASYLIRLEEEYRKKGIKFIYNYVGQIDKRKNAEKDLKRFGFRSPYVIDVKQTVVNELDVKTIGEIIVLLPSRQIIYKGPIDNQYQLKSAVGLKENYLIDILDSIISGKNVTSKKIPAFGSDCIIKRPVINRKVFWNDVAPVIRKKCTICHNPSGPGPIDYISYKDVIGRRAMFRHVIEKDLMPPWSVDPNTGPLENDLSLTLKEKALILKWLSDGSPGPSKGKIPQILWTKEESVKQVPDYIISLPEKVLIPAEGAFKYKRFIIPSNFKEDKWIKNVKFFLKPKVIHHVFLYVLEAFYDPLKKGIPSNIHKYSIAVFGSAGSIKINTEQKRKVGYKLPKGSHFILEIHYEPIGRRIIDDFTQIHINFLEKKPKYKIVAYSIAASNNRVNIPARASNYKIKASYKNEKTKFLLSVHPHMHLRGKANAIFITDPKGKKRKIFGLDPFLVKFERAYHFKNPIKVLKGSVLECVNWFDNSKNNFINPNPDIDVVYGKFKKNEMSLCHFSWLVPIDSSIKSQWIRVPY
ncbi:MAG: redoxin domain-containing protein [Bdellovibrionales bacterium]|nr:redoxin domain-containing protein [Bdellovibrionales bacterium]